MLLKGKTQAEVDADKLEQAIANKKAERDQLIKDCDWRQVPDAPTDKAAWAAYRQALRDITKQPTWPDVEWPKKPE